VKSMNKIWSTKNHEHHWKNIIEIIYEQRV
jgi:hypothetical protein